jgi:hypothetical protein
MTGKGKGEDVLLDTHMRGGRGGRPIFGHGQMYQCRFLEGRERGKGRKDGRRGRKEEKERRRGRNVKREETEGGRERTEEGRQ